MVGSGTKWICFPRQYHEFEFKRGHERNFFVNALVQMYELSALLHPIIKVGLNAKIIIIIIIVYVASSGWKQTLYFFWKNVSMSKKKGEINRNHKYNNDYG